MVSAMNALRDEHKSDPTHYIKVDDAGKRKSVNWANRYSKVLVASYTLFLAQQKSHYRPELISAYLSEQWTFPSFNSPLPYDFTAAFVQIGVLALLEASERWVILGDSLNAVKHHLHAAYETFQTNHILSAANRAQYKIYKDEQDTTALKLTATNRATAEARRLTGAASHTTTGNVPPRTGNAPGRGGGRGHQQQGWVSTNQPPSIPPFQQPPLPPFANPQLPFNPNASRGVPFGSVPASSVPAAVSAGVNANTPIFLRCTAPGCMSPPPPRGFATTPLCHFHHRQANPQGNGTPQHR
jgi:hypothetical protein